MAKATRAFDMRGVKDWFAGLSFEVQEKVLGDLGETFNSSKEERISALEEELSALRGGGAPKRRGRPAGSKRSPSSSSSASNGTASKRRTSSKKGVKVAPKYADGKGNTWAARGVYPVWIREYLKKRGNKLEDLLIKK